ncbi:MAG: competence/damage-inducible protein A [Bacteroidia bacterium]|nr:competence/damage-inducible protein A [Bacteroidia bacterium]
MKRNSMQADIITIGDEILIGQVIDTNSAWIAEQLNMTGINVRQIISVSDDHQHIIDTLTDSEMNAYLVIITGGLGPTKDDITKNSLCSFFGSKLVLNETVLQSITNRFVKRGFAINELNRLQAMVPDNCIPLPNTIGTAPGMWFERNGKVIVSLPGVPFEMKALMELEVIPRIKAYFKTQFILHRTVLTFGIPESTLAIKIADWEDSLPDGIKLAYLPSPGLLRLRLSLKGENEEVLKSLAWKKIEELKLIIPEAIYGYDDDSLEKLVGHLLINKNSNLAVAESCTGGKIASMITSISGCSEYFTGSVTAYSNHIKENVLKVKHESLEIYGAVSREVVEQMAFGVRKLFSTDYAIATSGIAGPDGGSEEKPVGTVWIAIASPDGLFSKKYSFGDNRERNIIRASLTALNMLRMILEK